MHITLGLNERMDEQTNQRSLEVDWSLFLFFLKGKAPYAKIHR